MVIMTPCAGDQLYPRRPTVSPQQTLAALTVLTSPLPLFSYHLDFLFTFNMTMIRGFWLQRGHDVNWDICPYWKGHPEGPLVCIELPFCRVRQSSVLK